MSTLVKIGLVVLVAAGAISIPLYRIYCPIEPARHAQISSDVRALATALNAYKQAHGDYPATLGPLVQHQRWERLPLDPWGHPYVYKIPGLKNPRDFDLFSAGPDGMPNTADDDWGGD